MNVVLATSGTGGDLFPGIAIADLLRQKGHRPHFVISGLGPEEAVLRRNEFPFEKLFIGRLKGQSRRTQFKTLLQLPTTLLQMKRFLKNLSADVVWGGGAYTSGPVLLAACLQKIPTAIFEPNAVAGFTNRFLGRWVKRVYIGLPEAGLFFPSRKLLWTGTPIRASLQGVKPKKGGVFTVLLLGGSLGAATLNRAMLEAFPLLIESGVPIRIHHQTGRADYENVRKRYVLLPGHEQVEVVPFIEDMKQAYEEADLLVTRAGASTVAELVVVKRPAIFVPYPFAVGGHQLLNARWLVEKGCGEVFLDQELRAGGGKLLASRILHYQSHPAELSRMGDVLGTIPGRDAARQMVEDLTQLGRGT